MRYLALLLAAALTLAVACGGDDGDGGSETSTPAAEPSTLEIVMGDSFFDPDTFTVAASAQLTVTTPNEGILIHNLRFAGPDNRYNTDDDAAHEEYILAGETGTVVWEVPGDPGEYDFRCDIHPDEMVGTATVE
jgi:plastocyanin